MSKNRNKPLTVEIKNGILSISIGIDTLKFVAERCSEDQLSYFDEKINDFVNYKIVDADEFAKDVKNALLDEEEDGTTPVHVLIDNACVSAIEDGSLGVVENIPELLK